MDAYLIQGRNIRREIEHLIFIHEFTDYEHRETKSVPLSIMVALPSALILSIAGGFVCWIRERDRERRQELSAAALAAAAASNSLHHPPSASSGVHQQPGRPSLMSGASHHHRHHPNEEADIIAIGNPPNNGTKSASNTAVK